VYATFDRSCAIVFVVNQALGKSWDAGEYFLVSEAWRAKPIRPNTGFRGKISR